jgi:hypothetical protein
MAAIVAMFLLARGQQPVASGELVELEHAVGYWLEHPYLEAKTVILDAAAEAAGSSDVERFVAGARATGPLPPADAEALEQEQSGLAYVTALSRCADPTRSPPRAPVSPFRPGRERAAPARAAHARVPARRLDHLARAACPCGGRPRARAGLGAPIFAGVLVRRAAAAALARWSARRSRSSRSSATGLSRGALGAFGALRRGGCASTYYTLRGMRRPRSRSTRAWLLAPSPARAAHALLAFMNAEVAAGNDWLANLVAAPRARGSRSARSGSTSRSASRSRGAGPHLAKLDRGSAR